MLKNNTPEGGIGDEACFSIPRQSL